MLGRHHLTLSVGTVAIVVLPLFTVSPNATLVVLVGAAIGSLIPDAAVFHPAVRGLRGGSSDLAAAPAILVSPFGYATKYLIYKPAVAFYDRVVLSGYEIAARHRGFSHSFLGLATMTAARSRTRYPGGTNGRGRSRRPPFAGRSWHRSRPTLPRPRRSR